MAIAVFALLGALLGAQLFDGLASGAAIGALLGWVVQLNGRVRKLEEAALSPATGRSRVPRPAEPASQRPQPATTPPATPRTGPAPAAEAWAELHASESPPPRSSAWQTAARAAEREPSLFERALGRLKDWFTTGNVPVKIGVVLSLFGVGFLVREAVDRHWMVIPLELGLALVAMFGQVLLAMGWRLRNSHRVYALSVQGGGIAVLYLVTYASFAIYPLLPAALAFGLLVALTAAGVALAVLQDSRALAVLGIVGGFMAPILASSGAGNHVLLFGYYLLLNVAILSVGHFKAWRELNLLGFVFTFGIGALWGHAAYRPEKFASTEPFLVAFVLLYTLIPVLFAGRQSSPSGGVVDGTLVFGVPIAAFALQSRLLGETEYGMAISAVALAAWYFGLASWLHRRQSLELRLLTGSLFGLGIAFVTIAIPLAFDARWTSAAWAPQGAAMIWLGLRQRQALALVAGVGLQLAAGAALLQAAPAAAAIPILNGECLGAALIAVAGGVSCWLLDRSGEAPRGLPDVEVAMGLLAWATAWWLWAGLGEIGREFDTPAVLGAALLFVTATALAALLAAPRLRWPRLALLGLLMVPAMILAAAAAAATQAHVLAGYGWLAWPAAFIVHGIFLRLHESPLGRLAGALHTVGYWLLAALLAWETAWQVDRLAEGSWPAAAAISSIGGLILATLRARRRLAWPIDTHWPTYLNSGCGGVLAVLALAVLGLNLSSPGAAPPLPYLPLLNPVELSSLLAGFAGWQWWSAMQSALEPGHGRDPRLGQVIATLLGLFLLTMSVARAVHHWSGVPFDLDRLAGSTVFQAALSIIWGGTALAGMLFGARRQRRPVWLAGAALMAVVVVKLFVVELGNTGTVERIVSFLGVGLLLLVVGYFAPVPPRARADRREAPV